MEKAGLLASAIEQIDKHNRRVYEITTEGRKALRLAKAKVWELFREFFEEELEFGAKGAGRPRRSAAGVPAKPSRKAPSRARSKKD
jgi:DNA-binding PadR family transcriptional regulator